MVHRILCGEYIETKKKNNNWTSGVFCDKRIEAEESFEHRE
jgi:hypothetical protein